MQDQCRQKIQADDLHLGSQSTAGRSPVRTTLQEGTRFHRALANGCFRAWLAGAADPLRHLRGKRIHTWGIQSSANLSLLAGSATLRYIRNERSGGMHECSAHQYARTDSVVIEKAQSRSDRPRISFQRHPCQPVRIRLEASRCGDTVYCSLLTRVL